MLGLLFTAAGLLSPIAPSPVLPSQPTLDLLWKKMGSQLSPWLCHLRAQQRRWGQDSAPSSHSPQYPAAVMPLLSAVLQQQCLKNSHCLWSDPLQSLTDLPAKELSRRVWLRISLTSGDLHTTSPGTGKPSAQQCFKPVQDKTRTWESLLPHWKKYGSWQFLL